MESEGLVFAFSNDPDGGPCIIVTIPYTIYRIARIHWDGNERYTAQYPAPWLAEPEDDPNETWVDIEEFGSLYDAQMCIQEMYDSGELEGVALV